jgi:hypothetical protein
LLRNLDSHEPSDGWPHRIAELQELGLQLGEFYQGQGALWRTEEWLVTRWQLSSLAAGYGHSFLLHPAWLTAALLMPVGEAAMVQRGIPLVSGLAAGGGDRLCGNTVARVARPFRSAVVGG